MASLIVGFGRAGEQLHLRCLRTIEHMGHEELEIAEIGAIDPRFRESNPTCSDVARFPDLESIQGFDPTSTVVHVCTPPATHVSTVSRLAELGYKKLIVEKPIAVSMAGIDELRRLQCRYHLDILGVGVWLSSNLTHRLREVIESDQAGPLRRLRIDQNKNRYLRNIADDGRNTAFEVEMPHQVALALYLGGEPAYVDEASCDDMRTGDRIIPYLGGAHIALIHPDGLRTTLSSDLLSSERSRRIILEFEDMTIVGHYPSSASVSHSSIMIRDIRSGTMQVVTLPDRPLTAYITECYRYFAGIAPRPVSDLSFNSRVVSLIVDSKRACGMHTDTSEGLRSPD